MRNIWTVIYEVTRKMKAGMLLFGTGYFFTVLAEAVLGKSYTNVYYQEARTRFIEFLPMIAWILGMIMLVQILGDYVFPPATYTENAVFLRIDSTMDRMEDLMELQTVEEAAQDLKNQYFSLELSETEIRKRLESVRLKKFSSGLPGTLLVSAALSLSGGLFCLFVTGFETPFYNMTVMVPMFVDVMVMIKMMWGGRNEMLTQKFYGLQEKMLVTMLEKEEQ